MKQARYIIILIISIFCANISLAQEKTELQLVIDSVEQIKYISESEHNELYSRCNPEKNDMLLAKVGTTGIPVAVDTDIPFSLFVSVA